jgi:hypothetical protein
MNAFEHAAAVAGWVILDCARHAPAVSVEPIRSLPVGTYTILQFRAGQQKEDDPMSNQNQKPGQQNQNPSQKPGQQQGGGQKPGQETSKTDQQTAKPAKGGKEAVLPDNKQWEKGS